MSDMVQVPRELLENLITNSQVALMYGGCSQSDKISIRKDVDAAEAILDAPQGQAGGWVPVAERVPEPGKHVAAFVQFPSGLKFNCECKLSEKGNWLSLDETVDEWVQQHGVTHWIDLPEAVSMAERDPLRVMDAELHGLLYGGPVEWLKCQTGFDGEDDSAIENAPSDGPGWRQPFCKDAFGQWRVVPCYTDDIAAAWEAEGDLPDRVAPDYMANLVDATRGNTAVTSPILGMWERERNLRRATPEQMVRAMLSALGVTSVDAR